MRLQHALLTHPGGREENQDYGGIVTAANGAWLLAVADGLGGHGGGAVASRLAVESVLQAAQHQLEFSQQGLTHLLQVAQEALHAHQRAEPHMNRMRTTLVLLLLSDNQALWLHVGDSRLYCVFQTKAATDSIAKLPLIPRQTCH